MKKEKSRLFCEFIKNIYGLSIIDYRFNLSSDEKKTLEIDYLMQYGTPIDWSIRV